MNKKPLFKSGLYRKAILLMLIVGILMSIFMIPAAARPISEEAYDTYTYWSAPGNRRGVSSAPMYEYDATITGASLGIPSFNEPSDVFIDHNSLIYLTDKNNNRIIVINPDYTLNTVISTLNYNGEETTLTNPSSVFVTKKGDIYIADTEYTETEFNEETGMEDVVSSGRVVITDIKGNVSKILKLPEDDVIPSNFFYLPEKIAVDSEGYVYVLSTGSYYGALLYDDELNFSGFYGANSVSGSLLDIFTRIYELYIMSDSQKENKEKSLPFCFTDITVDENNFIYTATAPAQENVSNTGQLKKLSPNGINILKNKTTRTVSSAESFNFSDGMGMQYPDGETKTSGGFKWRNGDVVSMDVDSQGYMYGLCQEYGHIFIYDQSCNQLSVFGGGLKSGDQKGTFMHPCNIQIDDNTDKVFVTDRSRNSITVYRETEYGALVKEAQLLTNAGDYTEAEGKWNEVLSYDRNSQLAYRGLARAALSKATIIEPEDPALAQKYYNKTLEYAKLGYDQDTYASAFTFVRNEYLTNNFTWLFGLVIVVIAGVIAFFVYMKKKEKKLIKNPNLANMFQCVVHPFEGASQIKYYGKGSAKLATIVLVLYFIATVCSEIYSGFMYTMIDESNYSSGFALIRTFGIVFLWTVANWGLTTLFQGKGNMKQIYIVTCYALIPQILSSVLNTVLSNVLVPEEALVMTAISTVCLALTGITLAVGIMTVHEMGFFKFLVMTIVIILGMLVCVFVIMMVFVLIQQLMTFIETIYKEVTYR